MQIKSYFIKLNRIDLWEEQDPEEIKANINNLIENLSQLYCAQDKLRITDSSYTPLYHQLDLNQCFLLNSLTPLYKLRLLHQCRTVNNRVMSFYANGNSYKIDPGTICSICNLFKHESLYHIFCECPVYNSLRTHYINKYTSTTDINANNFVNIILNICNNDQLNDIFHFTIGILKLRSFIVNE